MFIAPPCCTMADLDPTESAVHMRIKSTKEQDENFEPESLTESMILGVTEEGECVYIHTFENDILALEFLETMVAGLRADILSGLFRRSMN